MSEGLFVFAGMLAALALLAVAVALNMLKGPRAFGHDPEADE